MLPQTLPIAVERGLALVEAVDEPWLTRYAAQAHSDPSAVVGNEIASGSDFTSSWDTDTYLIQDKAELHQWVQSDTWFALEVCR